MKRGPTSPTSVLHTFLPASLAAVLGGAIFLAVASINLTAQGAYYDELHQAPAAFWYTGSRPTFFAIGGKQGFPILNMSYSGAVKSHIYGLYMRLLGRPFTIRSWRMLGLLFAASALTAVVFGFLRNRQPLPAILYAALFLTDPTILLTSRHDWGPTALALLLRSLLITLYLVHAGRPSLPRPVPFLLAAITAFAVFEKLSSIAIVPFLLLAVLTDRRLRTPASFVAMTLGGIIGGAPLLAVNLYSWVRKGTLISAFAVATPQPLTLHRLLPFLQELLSLGDGRLVARIILDLPLPWGGTAEALSLLLMTLLSLGLARSMDKPTRLFLLSYPAVATLLFAMPRSTWVHHWIVATPFQYAALARLLPEAVSRSDSHRPLRLRTILSALLLVLAFGWLAGRTINTAQVVSALIQGRASLGWDPSLTRLGEYAASQPPGHLFIAGEWGFTTQIYCLSQGNDRLMHETFWDYQGVDQLKHLAAEREATNIHYVAGVLPNPDPASQKTREAILAGLRSLPGWREVPADPETRSWRAVTIHSFRKVRP